MVVRQDRIARGRLRLPLFAVAAAMTLALPSAGLAVVSFSTGERLADQPVFDLFTPHSVDPELASRVRDEALERGIRFTPTGTNVSSNDRLVTVAVRVDTDIAEAISVRSAIDAVPGAGSGIGGPQVSHFNLGTARGYQSFARPQRSPRITLPSDVRSLAAPDLSEFEPARPARDERPSRLQPRIQLGDKSVVGRSLNTLDAIGSQTVDVGGSFSLSPNLNVTAGVRYSQDRDRLDPLTDSVQDSQAVYVGTQIRF